MPCISVNNAMRCVYLDVRSSPRTQHVALRPAMFGTLGLPHCIGKSLSLLDEMRLMKEESSPGRAGGPGLALPALPLAFLVSLPLGLLVGTLVLRTWHRSLRRTSSCGPHLLPQNTRTVWIAHCMRDGRENLHTYLGKYTVLNRPVHRLETALPGWIGGMLGTYKYTLLV